MQGNRRKDTHPELAVRRAVHALGLRYRVDARPLPDLNRRADLVFRGAKIAVFVDGCYWHGCPRHGTWPATNSEYWSSKIRRNVARDRDTDERLISQGWLPLRFWEHDDPDMAAVSIRASVLERGVNLGGP